MKKGIVFLALLLAVFSARSFAADVSGKIIAIEKNGESIVLLPEVHEDGSVENIELSLKEVGKLWGIESLNELKVGDEVAVQTTKDTEGAWIVESLKVKMMNVDGDKVALMTSQDVVTTKPSELTVKLKTEIVDEPNNPKYDNQAPVVKESHTLNIPSRTFVSEDAAVVNVEDK